MPLPLPALTGLLVAPVPAPPHNDPRVVVEEQGGLCAAVPQPRHGIPAAPHHVAHALPVQLELPHHQLVGHLGGRASVAGRREVVGARAVVARQRVLVGEEGLYAQRDGAAAGAGGGSNDV